MKKDNKKNKEKTENIVSKPKFVAMRKSMELTALSAVSSIPAHSKSDASLSVEVKINGKVTKIRCIDDLSLVLDLNTHKFLMFLRLWYTRFNSSKKDDTLNAGRLLFMLDDYIEIMGYSKDPKYRRYYFDQINKYIENLARVWIVSDFASVYGIITSKRILGMEEQFKSLKEQCNDVISRDACFGVMFNPELVNYFNKDRDVNGVARIGIFAAGALRLAESKSAYAMMLHILYHFSNRLGRSDQCTILVEDLLSVCPDLTTTRNDKIIARFEQALNSLSTGKKLSTGDYEPPVLQWEYRYGGKHYSPDQLRLKKLRFKQWLKAEVRFNLLVSCSQDEYGNKTADLQCLIGTTKASSFNWDNELRVKISND